jgi:hypothetical protein
VDPPSLAGFSPRLVAAAVQNGNFEAQARAWRPAAEQSPQELACRLLDLLPPHALAPHALALVRQLLSIDSLNGALVSVLTKLDLSADPDVRAVLWEALESNLWRVRSNALDVLEKQPDGALPVHVSALLRGLLNIGDLALNEYEDLHEDDRGMMRSRAISLLKRVDKCELAEHMQPLVDALADTDTPMLMREVALEVLSLMPSAAVAPHAQLLLRAMRQPEEGAGCVAMQIRERARDALCELEVLALVTILDDLLAAVADEMGCEGEPCGAATVLSKLPPAMLAEHVQTVLRALLVRSDWPGEAGAELLRKVDPSVLAAHTTELEESLRDNDVNVRCNAMDLLANFPSNAIAAHTEALLSLLSDSDPLVSKLAAELLAKLESGGLADELSTLLEKPEYAGHRVALLPALATVSGTAAPAPAAMRLLHDPDPAVRASAIGTLARLDPSALQENTGLLLTALKDSDDKVRVSAMKVCANLPAAALAQHVPTCLRWLKAPSFSLQWEAKLTLEKVNTSALAAHMKVLLGTALDGNKLNICSWKLIKQLPPAALVPHLACLLSILGKLAGLYRSDNVSNVQKVVQEVVSSMSPNSVARTVMDQDSTRKNFALDCFLIDLPADTLSLHAPLLLSAQPARSAAAELDSRPRRGCAGGRLPHPGQARAGGSGQEPAGAAPEGADRPR